MHLELKSGMNVLMWRVMGTQLGSKSRIAKPILIKAIEINGLAFTSECAKCNAGHFSQEEGAFACDECPRDHKSDKGATQCTPCDPTTEYAGK